MKCASKVSGSATAASKMVKDKELRLAKTSQKDRAQLEADLLSGLEFGSDKRSDEENDDNTVSRY